MFWAALSSVFWAFFRPSIAVEVALLVLTELTSIVVSLEGFALERFKPILR
jgi:hypothetical protein